ncbi:MAG: hypothetical protein II938_01555 [Alphaproteobacteria bacterium]|nr:hypothetical protein [Alphaproteobacteria bacterium]
MNNLFAGGSDGLVYSDRKKLLAMCIRMAVYFCVLIVSAIGIWGLVEIFGVRAFNENGIIENTQFALLMVSTVIFGVIAWRDKSVRMAALGLMALCMLGLCREQDAWFDDHLPIISWRIGYVFPILLILNGFRKLRVFKRQLIMIIQSPAFYMMFCAMVMVVPFAQCIGHRPLIANIIGKVSLGKILAIRRMIEESGELLGYTMLVLAAIELAIDLRKISKR